MISQVVVSFVKSVFTVKACFVYEPFYPLDFPTLVFAFRNKSMSWHIAKGRGKFVATREGDHGS